MIATIDPDALLTKISAFFAAAMVVLTAAGRAITAIENNPTLMGVLKSVFAGSSTTTQATPNNKPLPSVVVVPASNPGELPTAFLVKSDVKVAPAVAQVQSPFPTAPASGPAYDAYLAAAQKSASPAPASAPHYPIPIQSLPTPNRPPAQGQP